MRKACTYNQDSQRGKQFGEEAENNKFYITAMFAFS